MLLEDGPVHPCVVKIKELLEKEDLWYDYLKHDPVRTSQEASRVRPDKYTLSQGAKALIVRIREDGGEKYFVMLVVPGDERFNFEKTKELLRAKDIRFATEQEVIEITGGVELGGIPPFGNLFGLKVYADTKVLANDKIIFNAGDRRVSIAITTKDYKRLVDPQVVNIT